MTVDVSHSYQPFCLFWSTCHNIRLADATSYIHYTCTLDPRLMTNKRPTSKYTTSPPSSRSQVTLVSCLWHYLVQLEFDCCSSDLLWRSTTSYRIVLVVVDGTTRCGSRSYNGSFNGPQLPLRAVRTSLANEWPWRHICFRRQQLQEEDCDFATPSVQISLLPPHGTTSSVHSSPRHAVNLFQKLCVERLN